MEIRVGKLINGTGSSEGDSGFRESEEVSEFEYLRSFVSLDGDAEAELSHGLRERGKMMRGLVGLWRNRNDN